MRKNLSQTVRNFHRPVVILSPTVELQDVMAKQATFAPSFGSTSPGVAGQAL